MRTLIISGGRFQENFAVSFLKKRQYDYIIAVDRGAEYAEKLNLMPDVIVGDFDSYHGRCGRMFENAKIETYNPEKDNTDTEIAMRLAVKRKNPIDIICATGGRIDHFLGNIHILKIADDNGIEAFMVDEGNKVFLESHSFTMKKSEYEGKYVSFMPFCGTVTGMKLKGFKYTLDGYDLKPGLTRCISNEITDEEACIEFKDGCLIVINSSDVETE